MMTRRTPLLFEEATNADGVWALVVRSSHGVVDHIFRAVRGGDSGSVCGVLRTRAHSNKAVRARTGVPFAHLTDHAPIRRSLFQASTANPSGRGIVWRRKATFLM